MEETVSKFVNKRKSDRSFQYLFKALELPWSSVLAGVVYDMARVLDADTLSSSYNL